MVKLVLQIIESAVAAAQTLTLLVKLASPIVVGAVAAAQTLTVSPHVESCLNENKINPNYRWDCIIKKTMELYNVVIFCTNLVLPNL